MYSELTISLDADEGTNPIDYRRRPRLSRVSSMIDILLIYQISSVFVHRGVHSIDSIGTKPAPPTDAHLSGTFPLAFRSDRRSVSRSEMDTIARLRFTFVLEFLN